MLTLAPTSPFALPADPDDLEARAASLRVSVEALAAAVPKFAERVAIGATDECWPWLGNIAADGYGYLGFTPRGPHGNPRRAHRVAFVLAHGPIPLGAHICHRCDRPACQNPAHLWAGTASANMQDAVRKGRHRAGRVLSDVQVTEIREAVAAHRATGFTRAEAVIAVAGRFSVSASHVDDLVRGRARPA